MKKKSIEQEMIEIAKLFRKLNNKIVGIQFKIEEAEGQGRIKELKALSAMVVKMDMTEFLKTMSRFWRYLFPSFIDEMLLTELKEELRKEVREDDGD